MEQFKEAYFEYLIEVSTLKGILNIFLIYFEIFLMKQKVFTHICFFFLYLGPL